MKSSTIRLGAAALLAGALALPLQVMADASSSSSSSFSSQDSSQNAEYDRAYSAAMNGQYDRAIRILKKIVAKDSQHADAYNMLGFSYRMQGEEKFDLAWNAYEQALTLDPNHIDANEYLGELYLEMDDLARAEERLDVLKSACGTGCAEYQQLAGFNTSLTKTQFGTLPADMTRDNMAAVAEELLPYFQDQPSGDQAAAGA